MTRAGILSMQRILNYGSFLQAYGLKQLLEELGCEVQFADYHPGETLIPADGDTGLARKISKATDVLTQAGPMKEKIRFIRYKKNYAAKYYPYLGLTEERNYNPETDVLIIGSDEVFNCVQNNTNVGFCPELFGQGNRAGKLISYAASFGNTTMERLEEYRVRDRVGGWLKAFDAISVRDANSGRIVRELTGREPEYHLDPVLAYDFIGKCREIPQEVPEESYMLLYGYSGRFSREECREIRKYADRRGLKIFCIGGVQDCCDRFIDVDPFTVIAYFRQAECIVTDTFHGTILSVITRRPFLSAARESGYGNSEKMTDLLQRLKLEDRRIGAEPGAFTAAELRRLEEEIDYTGTDGVIRSERERTREYLGKWV